MPRGNGYKVEGFAPTSRAAQQLSGAGIESSTSADAISPKDNNPTPAEKTTLCPRREFARIDQADARLCGTGFISNDRVLLVGDTRQHEAVEAGRPFAQLQEAGMKTVKLDEIVRQRDPELKQVVEQLARGEVGTGDTEDWSGREGCMRSQGPEAARIACYCKGVCQDRPRTRLVVSPDNRSRAEINAKHPLPSCKSERRIVGKEEFTAFDALVPRQDLTGADRTWAARYEFNDVLLYSRTSKGDRYPERASTPASKAWTLPNNLLTVVRIDSAGQTHEQTYDPRRQQGVSVYRTEEKAFSVGGSHPVHRAGQRSEGGEPGARDGAEHHG